MTNERRWHPETAEVEMTYDIQCTDKPSRCKHIFIYKGDSKYFRDIEEQYTRKYRKLWHGDLMFRKESSI